MLPGSPIKSSVKSYLCKPNWLKLNLCSELLTNYTQAQALWCPGPFGWPPASSYPVTCYCLPPLCVVCGFNETLDGSMKHIKGERFTDRLFPKDLRGSTASCHTPYHLCAAAWVPCTQELCQTLVNDRLLWGCLKLTAKEIESTRSGCNPGNVGPVLWLGIWVCVLVAGDRV